MPRVQRYDRQAVTESRENIQENIQYRADQFISPLAGSDKAFASLSDAYSRAREAADNSILDGAKKSYIEATNTFENAPEVGALNQSGENAFNLMERMETDLKPHADEIRGKLNTRQQKMFNAWQGEFDAKTKNSLNKHMSKEVIAYRDAQAAGLVEATRQRAAFHATDMDIVEEQIAEQEQAIYKNELQKGSPSEAIKNRLLTETSKTRREVIENLVDSSNLDTARDFYDRNISKMTNDDSQFVSKLLKSGGLDQEAQDRADEILSKHGSNTTNALKSANTIGRSELRSAVKDKILHHERQMNEAERIQKDEWFLDGYNAVEKNPGLDPVQAVGRSKWERMSPSERDALKRLSANGGNDITDWNKYYGLISMATDPKDKALFLKMPLNEAKPFLAAPEFKKIVDLQKSMRTGDDSDKFYRLQSDTQIVNSYFDQAKIDYKKKDIEVANQIRLSIQRAAEAKIKEKGGRDLTDAEFREIVDMVGTPVIIKKRRIFPNSKAPLGAVDSRDPAPVMFDDIPVSQQRKIRDELIRARKDSTPRAVVEEYTKRLNQLRQRTYSGDQSGQ